MKKVLVILPLVLAVALAACNTATPTPAAMPMPSTGGPTVPAGMAYAEGKEIKFIHTEVSDAEIGKLLSGMMNSPVLVVPSLAKVPKESLATVYVFKNGLKGMGPLGFQPDVFDNPPNTPNYTPLRSLVTVTWKDEKKATELKSAAEVLKAETQGAVTLEKTSVVINMPFITWAGGQR